MIRSFVAGQFYEADFENLDKQIRQCFLDKRGPGALPGKRTNKKILGIISPHAGYFFSGPCQAWSYKAIAESKFPERFIILAPDHNGLHYSTTICYDDWETPLGVVRTDKEFIDKLLDATDIKKSPTIHEHAIEVQLPFLQYSNKDKLKDIKIVPIIVPEKDDFQKLGEEIAEIAGNSTVIISSDFTHYGPNYGFAPYGTNYKKKMMQLDSGAIEKIKTLKSTDFLNYVNKTKTTICGKYPIALGMEILKEMFAKKVQLLQYYMSSDIVKDKNSVGYASLSFE